MTAAITVGGLTVRYGEVLALDDVSFDANGGRLTGLLGANGSGKSTLFGALMGTLSPTSGSVRLFGEDPARVRRRGDVAYVPQHDAIDRDFPVSVRDVVMMGRYGMLGLTRHPRARDRDVVATAIDRVGLSAFASRSIGALSGGQRRRAFLARAIAQDAMLLLLDEPFAGVDAASETTIAALLRALRDEGRSILVSTHDLAGVRDLCDDAIILQRRLVFQGPASEAVTPARLTEIFGVSS
ncbi:metal ABC transporter ATP-binding protein [Paramicrobacterium chengjingii]|uniref:metal ABC transporter ATP-binding protein n=1 Tax=Paramicrobacterium chengjingii TaxID=2769067 RepID=UPI001420DC78|nr:metal ABC transporter ATP-binding protein [Microbacterium chengjingii]